MRTDVATPAANSRQPNKTRTLQDVATSASTPRDCSSRGVFLTFHVPHFYFTSRRPGAPTPPGSACFFGAMPMDLDEFCDLAAAIAAMAIFVLIAVVF